MNQDEELDESPTKRDFSWFWKLGFMLLAGTLIGILLGKSVLAL